jgi:Fe-S cluster biogenesis protein NfuA
VRALVDVYGTALARVIALVGGDVRSSLAQDELVHHLLVLHGIHPQPIEERITRALEELRSHGDEVELAAIDEGVACLRWSNARGCATSAAGVERAISESVLASAPELRGVEVLAAPDRRPSPAVIPAESLLRKPAASRSRNAKQ